MSFEDDRESPFADEAPGPAPRRNGQIPWKVAIIDDEQEVHDVTVLALKGVSFADRALSFLSARSARDAKRLLAEHPDIALVLLDVVMETDDAGLMLAEHIRNELDNQLVRVVLRTGCPGQAPEATVIRQFDISDYRTKTELTSTRLFTTVISALRTYEQLERTRKQHLELEALYRQNQAALEEIARLKKRAERERDYLREEVKRSGGGSFIGASSALEQTRAQIEAVARTDATVLILGESGVGKEVVAREIHEQSDRSAGPLVKVNCASVPRELFESEFFGHVRGSFTGAHKDRAGRFELADGGTLFLDEIGDMPATLQAKLLRVLEDGEITPVGATKHRHVDVRVLSATNADLQSKITSSDFRQDLFFRLARYTVDLPPLRDRTEDLPQLAQHFLEIFSAEMGCAVPPISPEALAVLSAHDFPGNIRELKNVMERALILSGGKPIHATHLQLFDSRPKPAAISKGESFDLESAEHSAIQRALEQTQGNVAEAARLLKIHRSRIYRKFPHLAGGSQ
ncbi:MAG TPA: sigma-54 dependent transcriptional regulator [Labilithrix sp.]|nr:sigma-54 dependent transcriptional regulator [Labilithrix sp.]